MSAETNTKTISVTMWTGQSDMISQAAQKRGVSVSEFIRAHVIPAAAQVLGIEQPHFPVFEASGFRKGAISIAAEQLGLTPEQFKQRMAEKAAEAMLAEMQRGSSNVVPVRRRRGA